MKNLIINIILTLLFAPIAVAGASIGSSLLEGKTIDEAVQILADQVVMLTTRVDTIEATQNSLLVQQASTTETQMVNNFDINAIKEQNALLKAQNEALTTKSAALEDKVRVADTELQNVKQIQQAQQAIISPPPVRVISLSASEWDDDNKISNDRIKRGASIPLRLAGINIKTQGSNVDTAVRSITVKIIGDYNPSMFTALRIEKAGAIVGGINSSTRWGNDIAVVQGDIVIPINISVKADGTASILVYGLIDPNGGYKESKNIQMQLVSIDVNGVDNNISHIFGHNYSVDNK